MPRPGAALPGAFAAPGDLGPPASGLMALASGLMALAAEAVPLVAEAVPAGGVVGDAAAFEAPAALLTFVAALAGGPRAGIGRAPAVAGFFLPPRETSTMAAMRARVTSATIHTPAELLFFVLGAATCVGAFVVDVEPAEVEGAELAAPAAFVVEGWAAVEGVTVDGVDDVEALVVVVEALVVDVVCVVVGAAVVTVVATALMVEG